MHHHDFFLPCRGVWDIVAETGLVFSGLSAVAGAIASS
jgi:hypothetical protein